MVYGNVALCLTAVTRCFHFWARCYNGLALLKKWTINATARARGGAGGGALPAWQIHAGHPTAVDERCSVSRLSALAPYARLHVNRAVRQRGTARMAIWHGPFCVAKRPVLQRSGCQGVTQMRKAGGMARLSPTDLYSAATMAGHGHRNDMLGPELVALTLAGDGYYS